MKQLTRAQYGYVSTIFEKQANHIGLEPKHAAEAAECIRLLVKLPSKDDFTIIEDREALRFAYCLERYQSRLFRAKAKQQLYALCEYLKGNTSRAEGPLKGSAGVPAPATYGQARLSELEARRHAEIEGRPNLSAVVKDAAKSTKEIIDETKGDYRPDTMVIKTIGAPLIGVSMVAAHGVIGAWLRKSSKLPTGDAPISCLTCGTTHLACVADGIMRAVDDGHIVQAIRCPHCGHRHKVPTDLKDRCHLVCGSNLPERPTVFRTAQAVLRRSLYRTSG